MPWLPEFDAVIAAAVRAAGQRASSTLVGGATRVDDPIHGRAQGADQLTAYAAWSRSWLAERSARATSIATTIGAGRAAGEFDLELIMDGETFVLPIAVVVQADEAGGAWARVYHSQWPLLGHHVVRTPLLARDPGVHESDVVGEYQAALAAGDAGRITATFESDGCFREPAGPQFRVCGREVLLDFFTRFFSAGGGIHLEHCTVTEDGVRTVLEFNAVKWGGTDLSPQAGVAVYERGATGHIREARIYDDVEGPVEG